MHRTALVSVLALSLALSACPKRTTRNLPEYQLGPEDAYLGGQIVELYEHQVLNRQDFIYSIAYSPDSRWVAYPHMVLSDFELSLADADSGEAQWRAALQPTEFDAEGVAFVGSDAVVAASRRGAESTHPTLRLFARDSGQLLAASFVDDERGYSQVDASPDQRLVAAVTYKDGNLVLRDANGLMFVGEARAHRGPATAVAFGPDGSLYTGGQDHSLAVWELQPVEVARSGQVRLAKIELGPDRLRALQVAAPGGPNLTLALDTGLATTAITQAVATRLGLEAGADRQVKTSAGNVDAHAVEIPELLFKTIGTGPVPAVICDQCVPVGCDAVLGLDLAARVRVAEATIPYFLTVDIAEAAPNDDPPPGPEAPGDEAASPVQAEAAPTPGAGGDTGTPFHLLKPVLKQRFELPGVINDIRVSRDGKLLCVALSKEPAERSLELYEREKNGEYPEPDPANAAALVDPTSGKIVKLFKGHRGHVVTADISPDGRSVVSGGWDNHLRIFDVASGAEQVDHEMHWLLRRARFAPDGRSLAVAAWTPPASAGADSKPAAVLYELVYATPEKSARTSPNR